MRNIYVFNTRNELIGDISISYVNYTSIIAGDEEEFKSVTDNLQGVPLTLSS